MYWSDPRWVSVFLRLFYWVNELLRDTWRTQTSIPAFVREWNKHSSHKCDIHTAEALRGFRNTESHQAGLANTANQTASVAINKHPLLFLIFCVSLLPQQKTGPLSRQHECTWSLPGACWFSPTGSPHQRNHNNSSHYRHQHQYFFIDSSRQSYGQASALLWHGRGVQRIPVTVFLGSGNATASLYIW